MLVSCIVFFGIFRQPFVKAQKTRISPQRCASFFGLGKRRSILATFSGERILRHRGISAKSWSRPAPSMAAAGPRQSQCKGAAAGLYAASVNTFGMAWKRKNMAFIAKTRGFYIQRERCRAAARRHIDKKCNFTR